MKLNAYAIYDMAAVAYMRPFFLQTDAQAERMFTDLAIDADHPVGQHPGDYSLIRIGSFNDSNGQFEDASNETVCTGLEAVARSRAIEPTSNYGGTA